MKRLILYIAACFLLLACKKDNSESIEDKTLYFLKVETGTYNLDVSMTGAQIADSTNKLEHENYRYGAVRYDASAGTFYGLTVYSKTMPKVELNWGIQSIDKGTYEVDRYGFFITYESRTPDGRSIELRYVVSPIDNADTQVITNITESNKTYIEGNFEGLVHGTDYSTNINGVRIIVPIKGSFRVKAPDPKDFVY
jgi:hypothetical protein